jgi:HEAT repeat protein
MTEGFSTVDKFCWAYTADCGVSPDTAQDSIHMMRPEDWTALRAAWATRPPKWREACAYVLGLGPAKECLPLLASALSDAHPEVAAEAAAGYAALIMDDGALSIVTPEVRERLEAVLAADRSKELDQVAELLQAITSASNADRS